MRKQTEKKLMWKISFAKKMAGMLMMCVCVCVCIIMEDN